MEKDYQELLRATPFLDENGNLKEVKYKPLEGNSRWSVENFRKGYNEQRILESSDDQGYSNLVLGDNSLLELPAGELLNLRRITQNYSLENLVGFGRVNAREIATIPWGEDRESKEALMNYAISVPLFNGNNEDFNRATRQINESKKKLKLIGETPRAYLEDSLKQLTGFAKVFFMANAKRLLQDSQGWAYNIAVRAVGEYGAPQFVQTNIDNAYNHGMEQENETNKAIRNIDKDLGQNPNEEDATVAEEEKIRRSKEIAEKYDNAAEIWRGLTKSLMDLSVQYIPEQQREKERD